MKTWSSKPDRGCYVMVELISLAGPDFVSLLWIRTSSPVKDYRFKFDMLSVKNTEYK